MSQIKDTVSYTMCVLSLSCLATLDIWNYHIHIWEFPGGSNVEESTNIGSKRDAD